MDIIDGRIRSRTCSGKGTLHLTENSGNYTNQMIDPLSIRTAVGCV
jgi:hypothetical protein